MFVIQINKLKGKGWVDYIAFKEGKDKEQAIRELGDYRNYNRYKNYAFRLIERIEAVIA